MSKLPTIQQEMLCLRVLVCPNEFERLESGKLPYHIFTKETPEERAYVEHLFKQKQRVVFCAINSHTGKTFEKEIKGFSIYLHEHFIVNW